MIDLLICDWLFFNRRCPPPTAPPFAKTPLGSGQPSTTAIVHYLSPLISRITFSHLGSLGHPLPPALHTHCVTFPSHLGPFFAFVTFLCAAFAYVFPEHVWTEWDQGSSARIGTSSFWENKERHPVPNEKVWLTNKFPDPSLWKKINGKGINQVSIIITSVIRKINRW